MRWTDDRGREGEEGLPQTGPGVAGEAASALLAEDGLAATLSSVVGGGGGGGGVGISTSMVDGMM